MAQLNYLFYGNDTKDGFVFNVTHSEGNILSFLRLFLPSLLYMLVATSFHYYRLVFLDYSKLPLLFLFTQEICST